MTAAGFFSYVRADDARDHGELSELRAALQDEVRMQSGAAFELFQDRNDLAWGQQWKRRLDEAVDTSTVLIPILTPGFFASPACRDEVERFLAREAQLDTDELILPIYYVSADRLDKEEIREQDPLAVILAARQYVDWREYRFESITSGVVRRAVAELARRIVSVTSTFRAAPSSVPLTKGFIGEDETRNNRGPALKTEITTHVVDPWSRGNFTCINEAVMAAGPGDRIVVRPGLYDRFIVDKALEIVGDGDVREIVVDGGQDHAAIFRASMGRVRGLTLRSSSDSSWTLLIEQGRLELSACRVLQGGLGGAIGVRGAADPRVVSTYVSASHSNGIVCRDGATGIYEKNEIAECGKGVVVEEGANVELRDNTIRDNLRDGIAVHNAAAVIEDNVIIRSGECAIWATGESRLSVKGNQISDGGMTALLLEESVTGTVVNNELRRNPSAFSFNKEKMVARDNIVE